MTRQSVLRLLWTIGLAAVVAGSLLPAGSPPIRTLAALRLGDKALHFLAYFGLVLLPAFAEERRVIRRVAAALLMLGVALELAQPLSPGRSFELADMAANAAGIVCGLLLSAIPTAAASPRSAPPARRTGSP